jgi:hypothetical protein
LVTAIESMLLDGGLGVGDHVRTTLSTIGCPPPVLSQIAAGGGSGGVVDRTWVSVLQPGLFLTHLSSSDCARPGVATGCGSIVAVVAAVVVVVASEWPHNTLFTRHDEIAKKPVAVPHFGKGQVTLWPRAPAFRVQSVLVPRRTDRLALTHNSNWLSVGVRLTQLHNCQRATQSQPRYAPAPVHTPATRTFATHSFAPLTRPRLHTRVFGTHDLVERARAKGNGHKR